MGIFFSASFFHNNEYSLLWTTFVPLKISIEIQIKMITNFRIQIIFLDNIPSLILMLVQLQILFF
jgi:hypothetical protein